MSADVLRRAAALMREEFTNFDCRDCGILGGFVVAVADWLDAIDFCECSECEHAAFVARAYDGESS